MFQEIERKFLVNGDYKSCAESHHRIVQGYICSDPARTVRVRISGNKGYITVKGRNRDGELARFEWEKEISVHEAEALLDLCEPGVIEKYRYIVPFEGHVFEVDEFYGANEGLVMAEVELTSENETIISPDWLGDEVTGDRRYYNSYLSVHPFNTWGLVVSE